MIALFTVTLFTSAALIFVAEPMFGKMVLPRVGGSPSVWNTCLLFFQSVLLGGYAYAHLITTRLPFTAQAVVHVGVLAAAALVLPIAIPADWVAPVSQSPVPAVLQLLLFAVGGPLFALCATAPILQKWCADTDVPAARDPYFLYAASNAGSLIALLAYPLVLEPLFTVAHQRVAWSAGFLALLALTVASAVAARRRQRPGTAGRDIDAAAVPRLTWPRRLRWLALAFVPSSLMLAVTAYLTTDVAAVPLLWTIPLALYLLSFIIAFAATRVVRPGVLNGGMIAVTLAFVLAVALDLNRPLWATLPLHLGVLFVIALALHIALADDRPATRHLTQFYLWIAAGGALGGAFNTFVAPAIFTGVDEYPLADAAAWLLYRPPPRRPQIDRSADLVFPVLAAGFTAGLVFTIGRSDVPEGIRPALTGLIVFSTLASSRHSRGLATAVVLMLIAGAAVRQGNRNVLFAERTFFGTLRVLDVPQYDQHRLLHGTTLHGVQSTDPARRRQPLAYYHPSGPIGQTFLALEPRLRDAGIGVIGLGAGGLSAYARPGQQWTFYEIDPVVERIARDTRFFTYLRDCGPTCRVVLGDARLSLARAPEPRYSLLVVDAFSSDAIPVHLLTREAIAVYLTRLEPDGVLAIHISNRHLNLAPVVSSLGAERGLVVYRQRFRDTSPDQNYTPSEWMLLARSRESLGLLADDPRWTAESAPEDIRVWTDDFSNIVGVLKMPWRNGDR